MESSKDENKLRIQVAERFKILELFVQVQVLAAAVCSVVVSVD